MTAESRITDRDRTLPPTAHGARSPRAARLLVLAAALLLSLSAGCATEAPANWVEGQVTASSDRVLWQVTVLALDKTGFPIGARMDPATLTAISGWKFSLAPFRSKGYREQCEVHYTPKGSRQYDVHVRVRREKNMDIVQPLDVTYAQWEADDDNAERAGTVLQYIKSLLGNEFAVGAKKKL
jgi:hypothetical protein